MKSVRVISLAFLAVVLMASAALAQAPELRGTWRGPSYVQTPGKAWQGKCAFVINEQNGSTFAGYKLWFDKNQVLQKEAFAGVYDGEELLFAEKNDGYGEGHLTGKQTMTIRYAEHGALVKAILYKLERVRFTTGFVEIDKDGNNVVMRAEITNHYPLNAERIIKEADTDKDGKLTKKEWDAWRKANNWE